MLDFEIDIALQEIRQETNATFEGEQFAGKGQVAEFRRVEEGGGGEVALHQRFEAVEANVEIGQFGVILAGGGGGGADHVAKVIQGGTRHGGVKVDDADALRGDVIQEDVVELGVVVGDPLRDFAGGDEVRDAGAIRGTGEREVDLRLDLGGAVLGVGLNGGLEGFEPFGGVVEIGDGLVEPRTG